MSSGVRLSIGSAESTERRSAPLTLSRHDETRAWASLAVSSLGVAGAFAVLVALSRVPGSERIAGWMVGFFAKGLVIHVVFSLEVWLLSVLALLVSLATFDFVPPEDIKVGWLGTLGVALVACAFPLLFLPAFQAESVASLNNYVPVIIHPLYYAGLAVLLVGIACPVIRLLVNAAMLKRSSSRGLLATAMIRGGMIYLIALTCLAAAFVLASGSHVSAAVNEQIFWGGGHLLQFVFVVLMLTGWALLTAKTFGERAMDAEVVTIAFGLLVAFALAGPMFYVVFEPFAPMQQEAFRRLQFVLGFPTLIVAFNWLIATRRKRADGALPWQDPAFLCVALSMAVFGIGGTMGLMISSIDTRTPAHYHGMIAGVNLACMGLFLFYVLPRIGHVSSCSIKRLRAQILLFGLGQLTACLGLFWAGGYGAPRKAAAGTARLIDGAIAGMYLNGIGALVAVVGGILFIVTVARALRSAPASSSTGRT